MLVNEIVESESDVKVMIMSAVAAVPISLFLLKSPHMMIEEPSASAAALLSKLQGVASVGETVSVHLVAYKASS